METRISEEMKKIERWIPGYLKKFMDICRQIYKEIDYMDNLGEGISIKEFSELWRLGTTLLDEYMAIVKEYADAKEAAKMEEDLKEYFQNVFYEKGGEKVKLSWDNQQFLERMYSNYVALKAPLLSFIEPRIIIPLLQTYEIQMSQQAFLETFAKRTCYREYAKFEQEKHLNNPFGSSQEEKEEK